MPAQVSFNKTEYSPPNNFQNQNKDKCVQTFDYMKKIQDQNDDIMSNETQKNITNLAYKAERYGSGLPSCIFLPSNDVLFKLMRAGIGIQKIEDLWIYTEEAEVPHDHEDCKKCEQNE